MYDIIITCIVIVVPSQKLVIQTIGVRVTGQN